MGEAKRKAERAAKGGSGRRPVTARGMILQRGLAGIEDWIGKEFPDLVGDPVFRNNFDSWSAGDAVDSQFFVFIKRNDGRVTAFMGETPERLIEGTLPAALMDFYFRQEDCAFKSIVGPSIEAEIEEVLKQYRAGDTHAVIHPVVSRLEMEEGIFITALLPKKAIQRKELSGLLRFLDSLVANGDQINRGFQRFLLGVEGYNDDPREIFQIDEVRQFFADLFYAAPWWLALSVPSGLATWLACVVDVTDLKKDSDGRLEMMPSHDQMRSAIEAVGFSFAYLIANSTLGQEERTRILDAYGRTMSQFLSGHLFDDIGSRMIREFDDEVAQANGPRQAPAGGPESGWNVSGLFDLATARTGRAIDMDLLQVVDPGQSTEMVRWLMDCTRGFLQAGRTAPPRYEGWAQEDGRLLLYVEMANGADSVRELPAGSWRELTPKESSALHATADADFRKAEEAGLVEAIAGELLKGMASGVREGDVPPPNGFIVVFDKSMQSLEYAKVLVRDMPDAKSMMDLWLAGDLPYLVGIVSRDATSYTFAAAGSEDLLIREVLPSAAGHIEEDLNTYQVRCLFNDVDLSKKIAMAWHELQDQEDER